jgi:hypothetical protein
LIVETLADTRRTCTLRILAAGQLIAYLQSAVAALLAVSAVFLGTRALAGGLTTPLGTVPMLLTAGFLAGLAGFARIGAKNGSWHRTGMRNYGARATCHGNQLPEYAEHKIRWLARGVTVSVAVFVIGFVLSLSRSNALSLVVLWLVILGEEAWTWRDLHLARRSSWASRLVSAKAPCADGTGESIATLEPAEPAADVLQQLTLRTTAEGGQELSGWLRMPLRLGQRNGSLHVAFCPSFARLPEVQAEAVAGPNCRIKAAQVLPNGVRLDVKLTGAAGEGESVLIWFHAASEKACTNRD